ncbi:Methyltransferase domain-containing protein [Pelagirhabdus alkalitolerans]|uniref:Methyltransferase domain-containing protein n=1 Tax=Pelagirhabdus alkalitolerans TaxID=1612202 RepID=A0A1G6IND7_9BACI|nr:methyltransferase domain-containing protein [Pelagirhabdus alkalitolerans]SDC08009.1 Methyltransferase domain-containing protein [Pelagirhabdus alkalitolerans]
METIEDKLAESLTAESKELIPYLPYLLQDLWELGSSPQDILDMISNHISLRQPLNILDLACGKGAVSVYLAQHLNSNVKGIDLMPEFIDFANEKAKQHDVVGCCEFEVGNITKAVRYEKDYDIVILGAVGDVLGTPEETITLLKNTVKEGCYIIIDDVYGHDETNPSYYTKEQWLNIFKRTGVKLIDEKMIENDELEVLNVEQQKHIVNRANELKQEWPDKADLFESYIQSQQAECDELENDLSGVTLLLQSIK